MTTSVDILNDKKTELQKSIEELRTHPIFLSLTSIKRIQVFMSMHVFSVWGYISLLRRLQLFLRGGHVGWSPAPYPDLLWFVNHLITSEETEQCSDGNVRSHFEMYAIGLDELSAAIQDSGKEVGRLLTFNRYIRLCLPAKDAAINAGVEQCVIDYIDNINTIQQHSNTDELLANIICGYTDPVHSVLQSRLRKFGFNLESEFPMLNEYLNIHISTADIENEGIEKLLNHIFDSVAHSPIVKEQIYNHAICAVKTRMAFWDGVLKVIEQH